MLIYNEQADTKLEEMLEILKAAPRTSRCIHVILKESPAQKEIREIVAFCARLYLTSAEAQMFVCEDGDMFIISSMIPVKDFRLFSGELSLRSSLPADESWVGFYQVATEINKLLLIVEEKIEKCRIAAQALRKHESERRRNAILSKGGTSGSEFIRSRRQSHKTGEIMIIEDDSFMRRLVKNVLNSQYHLTSLGEATFAIDTYTQLAPDILLLDINLPDVSGHELREKIISIDPSAYVVMLSGSTDEHNIKQAITLGAKGFIGKPFTREKLVQYIERCPTIKH